MHENPVSKDQRPPLWLRRAVRPRKAKSRSWACTRRRSRNPPRAPNIVTMKEPNEGRAGQPEEVLEGRAGAKENRRRVSTTLRQPAWEFSDYCPLSLCESAG